MNRRQMIGTLGLGAAGVAVTGVAHARIDDHDHLHGEDHEKHLETLTECAKVCNVTGHHALQTLCDSDDAEKRKAHALIHEATMDCQAFCVLTATLMARHSSMSHHAHAACAEACAQCAKVCKQSGVDTEEIRKCIEICEECEKHCRAMAKKPIGHHHHDAH